MTCDQLPQPLLLGDGEVVGRASPPVELNQPAPLAGVARDQRQLPGQGLQVGLHHLRAGAGGDAVAAAEPAGIAAEGHVHV